MTGADVLEAIRSRGVSVQRRDDRLCLAPRSAVTEAVLELARAHKPLLLLELSAAEVRWRALAMLAEIPRLGPVRGMLCARDGAWEADPARCRSCGDWIVEGETGPTGPAIRCPTCCDAARLAIEVARAGRPT